MKPDVSIIIVNYNGQSTLKPCIDSLYKSKTSVSFEVIIVDNHSHDNSLSILKELVTQYPQIHLIENPTNDGFSKGNNIGLKQAQGKLIWLLNNDTILFEDTLDKCVSYLNHHPNVGALSPTLLNQDGTIQTQGSAFMAWLFKAQKPKSVSFISGAAFFTRAAILDKTNGLDEAFFFYNEDIDLCKQIKKLGYSLILYPEAKLIHLGGHSTQTRKPESEAEGLKGGVYLVKKHYPFWVFQVYKRLILLACHVIIMKAKFHQRFETSLTGQSDCDNYANEDVAVIGGGNCACYAADFLADVAQRVYLIHSSDTVKAVATLKTNIMNNPKITHMWNSKVSDAFGIDKLEKLKITNTLNDQHTWIDVKAAFIYVGRIPPRIPISLELKCDEERFIITDDTMRTNIPGVYAVGDIRSKQIRQISTAISDGMIAAINAERDQRK